MTLPQEKALCVRSDAVDAAWWKALENEHVRMGLHAPMQVS